VGTGTAYRPLGRRDNSESQPGAARSFDVAGVNAEIQPRWWRFMMDLSPWLQPCTTTVIFQV